MSTSADHHDKKIARTFTKKYAASARGNCFMGTAAVFGDKSGEYILICPDINKLKQRVASIITSLTLDKLSTHDVAIFMAQDISTEQDK